MHTFYIWIAVCVHIYVINVVFIRELTAEFYRKYIKLYLSVIKNLLNRKSVKFITVPTHYCHFAMFIGIVFILLFKT